MVYCALGSDAPAPYSPLTIQTEGNLSITSFSLRSIAKRKRRRFFRATPVVLFLLCCALAAEVPAFAGNDGSDATAKKNEDNKPSAVMTADLTRASGPASQGEDQRSVAPENCANPAPESASAVINNGSQSADSGEDNEIDRIDASADAGEPSPELIGDKLRLSVVPPSPDADPATPSCRVGEDVSVPRD